MQRFEDKGDQRASIFGMTQVTVIVVGDKANKEDSGAGDRVRTGDVQLGNTHLVRK